MSLSNDFSVMSDEDIRNMRFPTALEMELANLPSAPPAQIIPDSIRYIYDAPTATGSTVERDRQIMRLLAETNMIQRIPLQEQRAYLGLASRLDGDVQALNNPLTGNTRGYIHSTVRERGIQGTLNVLNTRGEPILEGHPTTKRILKNVQREAYNLAKVQFIQHFPAMVMGATGYISQIYDSLFGDAEELVIEPIDENNNISNIIDIMSNFERDVSFPARSVTSADIQPTSGAREMTQAFIENLMRRNAQLYGDVVVEDEPGSSSSAPPSSDFDVLVDRPGTAARGRVPPPPYDIDGATTLTGNAGLGLDQFVPPVVPPLNAPRERQQAMHNIIVKEVMDKQNKAYNRIDNIQSRTATQRIANLETPLYDYSQTSARIRGLQPGNRPVII